MNGDEALDLLRGGKEGVKAWNLRRKADEKIPELGQADLFGADLEEANLSRARLEKAYLFVAHLKKANLSGARLEGAYLSGAHLEEAKLHHAHLEKANLLGAHLEQTDLRLAHLENASLVDVHLEGANLLHAHLEKAELVNAHLQRANLSGAHLEGANLCGARLEAANLDQAHLEETDLRGVGVRRFWGPLVDFCFRRESFHDRYGSFGQFVSECFRIPFKLDNTYIRQTRFSPRVADPWSTLRRNYTSASLALHLLLLVVFAIPYVGRTMFWIGTNRMAEAEVRWTDAAIEEAGQSPADSGDAPAQRRPAWHLLLGLDKGGGFFALVLVLLIYNAGRAVLTYFVRPLREQEERAGISPAWKEYHWLYRMHQVATVVLLLAVVSLLYHAWHWLSQGVFLPA